MELQRDGWGVRCKENVAEPGIIISRINGSDIKYMADAFYGCTSLVTVTEIPNSVTDMQNTFYGCTSLVNAPEIPEGVTEMNSTFYGCTSLVNAPKIPEGVTSMYYTFEGCTSLVNAPEIPNSVTSMDYTFYGCTSLVTAPEIPINEGVDMEGTFMNCTSLVTAPYIPENVLYYRSIFEGCTSLTGTIKIDTTHLIMSNVEDSESSHLTYFYLYAFSNVDFKAQNITLEGKSEEVIDYMGSSGINYCPDCNGGNCGC